MEGATAAVATALFGDRVPVLMHLTAARVLRAVPRALGIGVVATPRQHRPLRLLDRHGGMVVFVKRDVDGLDAVLETTDLGEVLVTTAEQTVLDLAKRRTRCTDGKKRPVMGNRSAFMAVEQGEGDWLAVASEFASIHEGGAHAHPVRLTQRAATVRR